MTDEEQPDASLNTGSVSHDASDWFRAFSKQLNANFIPSASDLPFEADIPDYQVATLRAVLQTLVESGMITEVIRKEVHQFFPVAAHVSKPAREFGLGKGKLEIVSDDDEHLEHFHDYLP